MTRKYDVVIVGAGPAGLMAAKTAVESGLRIALIERKKDISWVRRTDAGIIALNEYIYGQIVTFNRTTQQLVFPVAGISTDTPFFKRLAIIAGGMIPYGLLTLLISFLAHQDQQDISRSYNIIGGFAIIAVVVAVIYSPIRFIVNRFCIRTDFEVEWCHSLCGMGLMSVIVILQLLFLN